MLSDKPGGNDDNALIRLAFEGGNGNGQSGEDSGRMGMNLFDRWNAEEVVAGYTTDSGGLFRYHHPGDIAHFESLCRTFGMETGQMVRIHQRHTDRIFPMDASNGGEGIIREGPAESFDAMVTDAPHLMLCIITADCVPVFLYDRESNAIGLVHSGRIGTWKEISFKAVLKMQQLYGTRPENVECILGPHLCAAHHEVGKEELDPFSERFSATDRERFISVSGERGYVDMGAAIRVSLIRAGLKDESIFDCGACTYERPDLFSRRRDGISDAHILSFIALRG